MTFSIKTEYLSSLIVMIIFVSVTEGNPRIKKSSEAYIFAAETPVYKSPSRDAEIYAILQAGTKINVLEISKFHDNIGKVGDYWYRVTINDQDGYIWGNNIADYRLQLRSDMTFLALNNTRGVYSHFSPDRAHSFSLENKLFIRLVGKNGREVYYESNAWNGEIDIINVSEANFPGITRPVIVVTYRFIDEVSGESEKFFVVSNSKLKEIFSFNIASEEGGCNSESSLKILARELVLTTLSNCADEETVLTRNRFTFDSNKMVFRR